MLLSDQPLRVTTYVGADGRPILLALVNANGTPIQLSGYTVQLSASLGGEYKISRASCTIEDESGGGVSYTPNAMQIATPGVYQAQLRLVNEADLVDYSQEFEIEVKQPRDNDAS